MMKAGRLAAGLALAALVALSPPATGKVQAGTIAFVPPNDLTGHVWSTSANDGWGAGRGIVFQMAADTPINSVGLYQDLTNVTLDYSLAEVNTLTGQVDTGQTLLRAGGSLISTSGLQWIDDPIAPLTLLAGHDYHLQFQFTGSSNQNFFYNNNNVTWSQGSFTALDGTQRGNTSNYVVAAFRVTTPETAAVPEPTSLALLATGGLPLLGFRRRRRA